MRWRFLIGGWLALSSFFVMEVKSMDGFIGKRVVRSYTQTIHAAPEAVFPLLCPVREAEWLRGWKARVIHADSGLAETNGVYASLHPGESDTIWMITQRDERQHTIEFVYFVPGMRVTRLNIAVLPAVGKNSRVEITYIYTGISEEGNREIAEHCAEDRFVRQMKHWEDSMNHFLETGKTLPQH
jgi:hypothetical protein